ncbi:MAG: glycosyltransferase [Thermoanaerobaculia bacterium]|nr:glycosyltransferase [Thermoanaerobaculia bacterium]
MTSLTESIWAHRALEVLPPTILVLYYAVLGILALYGLHRLALVWSYRRHDESEVVPPAPAEWPAVTVQLPLFNERYVAERLIEAVCALEYPRHRLEIQVLDDSVDETRHIVARKVEEMKGRGLDIVHLHREDRHGYKAGALAAGCAAAKGELLAVFDADFVPPPSFLVDSVPYFTADPGLGMAQARWGHLNREQSLLTAVQAILLDGHFVVEHTARHRTGCLFNFNGTAGIWRRQAIRDAGGWDHDTLTEDLDLSYRAQLAGWRFHYLPDLVVPAELPADINAYKSQQHRWAKGSIQTARKLLGTVLGTTLPFRAKLEAFVHLTANASYLLMLLLSALIFPAMYLRRGEDAWMLVAFDLPLFLAATVSVVVFFVHSQKREGGIPAWRCLLRMPALMAVGIGLSVNNAQAVWNGLWQDGGVFHRTPKAGETKSKASPAVYRLRANLSFALETTLALYFFICFALAIHFQMWLSIPFLWLFLQGYVYMTWLGLQGSWHRRVAAPQAA